MVFDTDSFKFLIIYGLWNEQIYEFVDFCFRRIYPYFIQVSSIKASNTLYSFEFRRKRCAHNETIWSNRADVLDNIIVRKDRQEHENKLEFLDNS